MRGALVIVAATLALAGLAQAHDPVRAAAGTTAPESFFLVRPDARMCPSPRCGGAWVRQLDHLLTRCHDGRSRTECYVATVSGIPAQLGGTRAGSVLARGRLAGAGIDGFPGLATLVGSAAWRPAGTGPPRGRTFRVRDNGVRCVTAPCFSLTAAPLGPGGSRTLSGVDLGGVAGLTAGDRRRLERGLSGAGAIVTGTIVRVPDAGPAGAGRTLRATQAWLRA
jgi:hypothetical protein